MDFEVEEDKPKRGRPAKSEVVEVENDSITMKDVERFCADPKQAAAFKKLIISLGYTLSAASDKVKKDAVQYLKNNK